MHSTINTLKVRVTFALAALTLSIITGTTSAFGHNFSTDENANFIVLVDLIKTEADLVQDNIASNNMSLASEHADKALSLLTEEVTSEIAEKNQRIADELGTALTSLKTTSEAAPGNNTGTNVAQIVSDLNAILDEAITTRIDEDVLNNSTIQALALADLLDGVLSGYGDAYAVGFDMTNMSNMMAANASDSMENRLVNLADYQTALALAMRSEEAFGRQFSDSSADVQSLDNIASAMQELISAIDNRRSALEVMEIVHTKLHPNFITVFGLDLN